MASWNARRTAIGKGINLKKILYILIIAAGVAAL
jgi:hypothetical protein